jgi:hypothetical protein
MRELPGSMQPMVIVLEVTPQPPGPEIPEPSPPIDPGPGQVDVPSPDPRGPETPDHPIDPDPPQPVEPAEVVFRPNVGAAGIQPRGRIRPWRDRRCAPCGPLRRPR